MEAAASPLFIVLLWVWALIGAGRLGRTSEAALHRRRAAAASLALGLCLVLAALSASGLLPAVVVSPLAALACLMHGVFEPTRGGLWHHRRLRPLGLLGLVTLATLLAVLAPRPDAAALAFAAAIFHHHLATGVRHQAAGAAEVDELRTKLLSTMSAERLAQQVVALGSARVEPPQTSKTARGLAESDRDKATRAG